MSRRELAEEVNAFQWRVHGNVDRLDETDVGRLERGEYRWPGARRREAFRAVLGADSDGELGFWISRRQQPIDADPGALAPVDGGDLSPSGRSARAGSDPPRGKVGDAYSGLSWAGMRAGDPMAVGPAVGAPVGSAAMWSEMVGQWPAEDVVGDLIEWARRMRRRDLLQWLTATTAGVAAASAAAAVADGLDGDEKNRVADALATPERVDDAVVGHLEAVLWRCARLDDSLGPQAALDTVLAQRALVQTLLARAGRPVRDRLLGLYADLCGFAGWLSFDLANHPGAVASYETARAAAHDAGNDALAALILCNMSQTATWHRQPRVGIDHATAAQRWADRTSDAPLRAYARDVAARAYAGDQQPAAAHRAIDHARELLAKAGTDAPTLVYFYTPGQLASTESACHLKLGDPQRAGRTAEAALAAIGPKFVRNRALVTLRLASCRLRGPAPDVAGAAEAFGDAARLAGRHRSTRVARQLHRGWRELQPWHHTADVRPVRAQLAALRLLPADPDDPAEPEAAGPDGLRSSNESRT
jgi:hypothetical protein